LPTKTGSLSEIKNRIQGLVSGIKTQWSSYPSIINGLEAPFQ
jgi:hypothetical protein